MSEKGGPCLSPQMTVLDILNQYRSTEAVFRSWDGRAGVCICCKALFDTVEQVADQYNLDLDRLMAELTFAANSPKDIVNHR